MRACLCAGAGTRSPAARIEYQVPCFHKLLSSCHLMAGNIPANDLPFGASNRMPYQQRASITSLSIDKNIK